MLFASKRTKGDAWIGDCGGTVAQKAEAKAKRDELHHQLLGNIVCRRRETTSYSRHSFDRMIVESYGDRFAPEDERLVLQ
jgi:hypothetical protein